MPKKCSAPPEYPHTRLDARFAGKQRFGSGEKVYYNCAEDFTPSKGIRVVQCVDGTWGKLTLKCESKCLTRVVSVQLIKTKMLLKCCFFLVSDWFQWDESRADLRFQLLSSTWSCMRPSSGHVVKLHIRGPANWTPWKTLKRTMNLLMQLFI